MAEVSWTPQAADDLEAITDFIAADSPHYASLFVIDVFSALGQHQWRGRIPRSEYVKLAAHWNPVHFDPDRWLDVMEEACI